MATKERQPGRRSSPGQQSSRALPMATDFGSNAEIAQRLKQPKRPKGDKRILSPENTVERPKKSNTL